MILSILIVKAFNIVYHPLTIGVSYLSTRLIDATFPNKMTKHRVVKLNFKSTTG